MKRKDVQAGAEYATTDGTRVQVHEVDPGWAMEGNRWVQRPANRRRYEKGKGWREYPSNYDIRVRYYDPVGDRWVKTVLPPRALVCPWEEYETKVVQARAQFESDDRRRDYWEDAFREKGLDVQVNVRTMEVCVPIKPLALALGIDPILE